VSRDVGLQAATSLIAALVMTGAAAADEVNRSNWVPNVGNLNLEAGEQPLGDLWTFRCPAGATVSLSVDTKDDTDVGQSLIDPVLLVVDPSGNLVALADDEVNCTYLPVCPFNCPSAQGIPCGKGGTYSVVVRDYGASDCVGGGGYELTLTVDGGAGGREPKPGVSLGGGPGRHVPPWAVALGKAPVGPALDDEDVPHGFEFFESNSLAGPTIRSVRPESLRTKPPQATPVAPDRLRVVPSGPAGTLSTPAMDGHEPSSARPRALPGQPPRTDQANVGGRVSTGHGGATAGSRRS
jgi:hypothetical protein